MYDRKGKYQWLDPVSSEDFDPALTNPAETKKEFHVTVVANDADAEKIADKTYNTLSTRTPGGVARADYNKSLDEVMDDMDAALEQGSMFSRSNLVDETSEEEIGDQTVDEAREEILNYFHNAIAGKERGKAKSIGKLTQEGKAYLEALSGMKFKENVDFVLNPSKLVHIYKDHYGKNEKDKGNNVPLTDEDIRNLFDIIARPDSILFGIESKTGRKMFFFFKKNVNGTYNLAEVYGDRRGNLTATSLYNTKKEASQRVMEIKRSLLPTSVTYSGATPSLDAKIPTLFEINNNNAENVENNLETTDNGGGMMMSTSPADQVYTDNFKNWFGDWENDPENASKVVDEDGRPLVVRLIAYIFDNYGVDGILNKNFDGNEKVAKLATAIQNYYKYGETRKNNGDNLVRRGQTQTEPRALEETIDASRRDRQGTIQSEKGRRTKEEIGGAEKETALIDEAMPRNTGQQPEEDGGLKFSVREKPAPEKTIKVYKLMRLNENNELCPLFIDGTEPIELGVWYDADSPNMAYKYLEQVMWSTLTKKLITL